MSNQDNPQKAPMTAILIGIVVLLVGAVGFLLGDRLAGGSDEETSAAAEAPAAPVAATPEQAPSPESAPTPTATQAAAPTPPAPPSVQTGNISKGGITWEQTIRPIETNVVSWGSKIRAIPSDGSNASVLGSAPKGTPVKVLATTNVSYLQAPWHYVQVGGLRGYISGDFLCATNGADPDMFYNSNSCQ